jgi:branched-chain amino acid transport system substrate-binding protein
MVTRVRAATSVALCLALIMTAFATGCQTTTKTVKEVKVGAVYPLTGPTGSDGQLMIAAFELAIEIVNGKYDLNLPLAKEEGLPGFGGAKLVLVTADHQGNAEVAYSETQRLITQEKVVAVVGAYQSACSKTASQAAEREAVPFINVDSTSPALGNRGFNWYFRTTPDDNMFIADTFTFLKDLNAQKNAGLQTIALLNEDSEAGVQAGILERSLAASNGFKIIEDIKFHSGTTDLTSEALKLKAANADVLLSTAYTPDVILLLRTLKEQKYMPKLVVGQRGGWCVQATIDGLGSDFSYMTTTDVWAPDLTKTSSLVKAVNDMYVQKTGKNLNGATARAFVGMLVVADALNRAASSDNNAIRRALEQTNMPADQLIVPWSGVKFDPVTHQNAVARGLVTQVLNNSFTTVWPFEMAAAPIVFPVPAWDQR